MKRTLTMRVDVNTALVEYLEAAALAAYRQWDADAGPDERAALDALAADDDQTLARGATSRRSRVT